MSKPHGTSNRPKEDVLLLEPLQNQTREIVIYWRTAPSRPAKSRRSQQLQLPLV